MTAVHPGGARRSPGADRRSQEKTGGARKRHGKPGRAPWPLLIRQSVMRLIPLFALVQKPMKKCLKRVD